MSIYRFQPQSLIDEITLVKNAAGGVRAYFHARSDVSDAETQEVQTKLSRVGWKFVRYALDGKPTLEVRGFKNAEQVLEYARLQGWTQGPPTIEKTDQDHIAFKEKFRNFTLKTCGVLWGLGDLGYNGYAIADFLKERSRANLSNIGAGLGYAVGSAALIIGGGKDQSEREIKDATRKMQRFLLKESVNLPPECSIHEILKEEDKGLIQSGHDFIKRYPSEILNAVYILVGLMLGGAAFVNARKPQGADETLKKFNARKLEKWMDVGLGAITTSSAAVGLFVTERKPVEGEPEPEGAFNKIISWVREQPLRVTGYGYMVATLCHAVSTAVAYKNGDIKDKKIVMGRALFVVANLLAEIMISISSKGHGEGVKADNSVDKSVIAIAADLVSKQNPAYQEVLIDHLAGYLSSPDVLGCKAEVIAAGIHEQLAVLQNSPWARTAPAKEVARTAPAKEVARTAPVQEVANTNTAAGAAQVKAKAVGAGVGTGAQTASGGSSNHWQNLQAARTARTNMGSLQPGFAPT